MDHFNTSAGSASAPAAPAAPDNPYFTSGNPSLGVPATVPGPYWFHMISEEIRNVILQAGLVPSHENVTQLFEAIEAIIVESLAPDASQTVKGIIEIATDAETQTGTDTVRAITPANLSSRTATETRTGIVEKATAAEAQAYTADKYIDGARLVSAFQGVNQSLTPAGRQRLPGGLIIQWDTLAHVSTTPSVFVFPIAFPNAVLSCVPANLGGGTNDCINMTALSNSGVTIVSADGSGGATQNGTHYYIAIGY